MNMQTSHSEFSAATLAQADMPFLIPGRPPFRYDLPKAWRYFRALVKNKEDTTLVFPIFEALPWKGIEAAARKFCESDAGKAIFAAEPHLPDVLDDHAALRAMPAGSLAHVYCDFMEREGLSAGGLVEEFETFLGDRPRFDDRLQWYFNRMRDSHDLIHILTSYGRDALGEQCVLTFTYGQQPTLANLFIGYVGVFDIKSQVKSKAPVLRAVREGHRQGNACPRLIESSILDLLPLPIEEVRQRLNIAPPRQYNRVHEMWRAQGVDPYDILGKQAA